MKIRFLGTHNSESIDFAQTCFTLDGQILFDCGSAASRLTLNEQQQLKGIFLSHAHYDHIKDLPALGMNFFLDGAANLPLPVLALAQTLESVRRYLSDDCIYSDFFAKDVFKSVGLEADLALHFQSYQITPIAGFHKIPCVGYHVQKGDIAFYYTGDTQNGFAQNFIKNGLCCDLLIAECTMKNAYRGITAHLCPKELATEIKQVIEHQGYAPMVMAVHRSSKQDVLIHTELEEIAAQLNVQIFCPEEGTEIEF